jgi:hypothetical protein
MTSAKSLQNAYDHGKTCASRVTPPGFLGLGVIRAGL